MPTCTDPESLVFYFKMMGDYMRYLAEIAVDEERAKIVQQTIETYEKAVFHAERKLDITNPTRLSLVLNYSVFYKEIMNEVDKACGMSEITFNCAIEKIEDFADPKYKDTIIIMQLMRDNMTVI